MSERDRSSGGTGCLILDARLSKQEVDRDLFPFTHGPPIRLGETRPFPSTRLDDGLTGVFNRGGTCTGEP